LDCLGLGSHKVYDEVSDHFTDLETFYLKID